MARRKIILALAAILFLTGSAVMIGSLMIPAKARLSAVLIGRAWGRALAGDRDARPWPWMDSVPVARLEVPDLGKDLVVMRGVSGEVLAFAPGWHEGSDPPGSGGITVISAHRDTHFGFLRNLRKGQEIILTGTDGAARHYGVEDLAVVQEPEIRVDVSEKAGILLLTTCYPFAGWQPGGDMRFVVVARERVPPPLTVAALN